MTQVPDNTPREEWPRRIRALGLGNALYGAGIETPEMTARSRAMNPVILAWFGLLIAASFGTGIAVGVAVSSQGWGLVAGLSAYAVAAAGSAPLMVRVVRKRVARLSTHQL